MTTQTFATDVSQAFVHAPEIARAAQPGQFLTVRPALRCTDPFLPRAMAALPGGDGETLQLIWKNDGPGAQALEAHARLGGLEVLGPFGNGFRIHADRPALLIYEDIGAVALAFLAHRISAPQVSVQSFQSGSHEELWRSLFPPGTVDHQYDAAAIYAAGPRKLLDHLLGTISPATPMQFAFTNAPMACGVGTCIACAVATNTERYARVCTEGPVFDASLFR